MKNRFVRRLSLTLTLLLCAVVLAWPAQAQDTPNAFDMAQYFTPETLMMVSLRTDEAYFDTLDRLATLTTFEGLPSMTVRDTLNQALMDSNAPFMLDDILAWAGDRAAVGFTALDAMQPDDFVIVAEVESGTAAIDFFRLQLNNAGGPVAVQEGMVNDFFALTSEGMTVAANDDLLIIAGQAAAEAHILALGVMADTGISLATSDAFTSIVGALPASHYNIGFYADFSTMMAEAPPSPVTLSTMAAGATILDGATLTIDVALPDQGTGAPTVDPAFARYLPGDTSSVVILNDLSHLYDSFITVLETSGTAGVGMQVQQTAASLGFNLQEDIFSWATGDYAVLMRTDLDALLPLVLDDMPDLNQAVGALDVGILIATSDAQASRTFIEKVETLITMVDSGNNLTFAGDTINGVDVTTLDLSAPAPTGGFVNLSLAWGVTDEVFFFGTSNAVQQITSGMDMLNQRDNYNDALGWMLPDATSIWYTDGDGLITSTGGVTFGVLALLGPAIGNVFENIVDELESGGASAPVEATRQTVQFEGMSGAELLDLTLQALELIHSSTISTQLTADGVGLMRLTITYVLE